MKIESKNWRPFKLGDLFSEIYKAKSHTKADYEYKNHSFSNSIRFISRTDNNNGCDCYISKTDNLIGVELGNAIVIGDTTASCSYQDKEFVCGDHMVVCRAKWINYYTAMFILTLIKREKYKYNYGRAFKMNLIANTIVHLPVNSYNNPDWSFIENLIKSLNYKPISSKNTMHNIKLNVTEWKDYKVGELFKIINGIKYPSYDREIGILPLVSTTASNNGISDYISDRPEKYSNILTVAYSGSVGATFYQEKEVFVGETVFALIPKFKMNKYIAMFICTILNYHNFKYTYGRKIIGTRYVDDIIKLPTINNQPDWAFMEDYIKSLPYADRI